ncbi:protein F37C4.5-like isoform X1 [Liolophura sinensis]|uniref:protein F37C4.5-like isoform X1 n=1 Tax=Liolophura sinensis TaxID=3198878 RepID=UPI003158587D
MMASSTEKQTSSKAETELSSKTEESNSFNVCECPVEKVVVYQDRAEVCRVIETTVKKGENEVIVKNLSNYVDEDSIRVEGKGTATILEVTYQTKYDSPSKSEREEYESKGKALQKELEALDEKLTELQAAKVRFQKQWTVLDQFSTSVTTMGASVQQSDTKTTVTKLDKGQLEGISEFFKLYNSQATHLDTSLLQLDQQMKKLQEEKVALQMNMQELGLDANKNVSRQCSIMLESSEPDEAKITLLVSYVVSQASWTPKYDIRVFPEEKKLKVMYYGLIKQSTGEDWEDAKLFLSTAMPSIGGIIPTLGRSSVSLKRAPVVRSGGIFRSFRKKRAYAHRAQPQSELKDFGLGDGGAVELCFDDWAPPIEEATSQAQEGLTSTTFEITRSATIPCDNVGHKVAVGIVDLSPEFEYETIPLLAPHAFLKARVTNKSQYAFLPGPTNIFLDNNFVAKSFLDAVSPAEEFLVSLGVDPAVRIKYKPLHKYEEKSGLLTKVKTVTYKQDIEVKNTHTNPMQIKVVDHVPVSNDDKIKVNILEPPLSQKHPEKTENTDTIKLTKDSHVEWQITVKESDKKEITLKYTIEYPAGEAIDISTV